MKEKKGSRFSFVIRVGFKLIGRICVGCLRTPREGFMDGNRKGKEIELSLVVDKEVKERSLV